MQVRVWVRAPSAAPWKLQALGDVRGILTPGRQPRLQASNASTKRRQQQRVVARRAATASPRGFGGGEVAAGAAAAVAVVSFFQPARSFISGWSKDRLEDVEASCMVAAMEQVGLAAPCRKQPAVQSAPPPPLPAGSVLHQVFSLPLHAPPPVIFPAAHTAHAAHARLAARPVASRGARLDLQRRCRR